MFHSERYGRVLMLIIGLAFLFNIGNSSINGFFSEFTPQQLSSSDTIQTSTGQDEIKHPCSIVDIEESTFEKEEKEEKSDAKSSVDHSSFYVCGAALFESLNQELEQLEVPNRSDKLPLFILLETYRL